MLGAHKTNIDSLKADGTTFKWRLFQRKVCRCWQWLTVRCESIKTDVVYPTKLSDPMLVRWETATKKDWHFKFICHFSTNKNDTLFSIAQLEFSSKATSFWCLPLLQSIDVACDWSFGVLAFLGPVTVKRWIGSIAVVWVSNYKSCTLTRTCFIIIWYK